MAELVPEIETIQIIETKSEPPHVIVHAVGKVPTTGWTHPVLDRPIEFVQPVDGIVDFEFLVDKPSGIVGHVVLPIAAHSRPFLKQSWMKGVRVRGAAGSKEAKV